jgi:DNA-binding CsgD family transcriptional regulator
MPFPAHSLSPVELASLLEAEREGDAFLAYKDAEGRLRLETLAGRTRLTIGRVEHTDLPLTWDPEVSRSHALLEQVGGAWTLMDDGLSRNGSFVNGNRVSGRRRLQDGDMLRIGATSLLFRAPASSADSTAAANAASLVRLSEAERRVLLALCRPFAEPGGGGAPATNREIAGALHLSIDGVKTHVRALFAKLEIEDMPQYRKRTELARRALNMGLVSRRDLRG